MIGMLQRIGDFALNGANKRVVSSPSLEASRLRREVEIMKETNSKEMISMSANTSIHLNVL